MTGPKLLCSTVTGTNLRKLRNQILSIAGNHTLKLDQTCHSSSASATNEGSMDTKEGGEGLGIYRGGSHTTVSIFNLPLDVHTYLGNCSAYELIV